MQPATFRLTQIPIPTTSVVQSQLAQPATTAVAQFSLLTAAGQLLGNSNEMQNPGNNNNSVPMSATPIANIAQTDSLTQQSATMNRDQAPAEEMDLGLNVNNTPAQNNT